MAKAEDAGTTEREKVYDEQIAPLMSKIIDICKANKIPIVASFDLDGPEDEGLRCTTVAGVSWEEMPETFKQVQRLLYPPKPQFMAFTVRSER